MLVYTILSIKIIFSIRKEFSFLATTIKCSEGKKLNVGADLQFSLNFFPYLS